MAVYRVHAGGVWSRLNEEEVDRKREDFIAKLPERFPSLL
jgi:hypothetical protein